MSQSNTAAESKIGSWNIIKKILLPMIIFFILVIIKINLSIIVPLKQNQLDIFNHILSIGFIITLSWLLIRLIKVGEDYIGSHYIINIPDNLHARKVHTQMRVIEKILIVVVLIISFSTFLMTFEKMRQFGTSLLASAGIFGIVLGFAAQKSIATLFAGLQIAITQPLRIDDVVIVENEWGWIEEINLTYIVVRIWDLRRLIVPPSYFIDKPFQNWTRTSASILGTVFIYADYKAPIQSIRNELKRILDSTDLWDKKVCNLQITNASSQTIEIRALMSASTSPIAWDLRCLVREKLIVFLQENYPESLPRYRIELGKGDFQTEDGTG
ncbi:MAG: mechanosensitive ion channel domain-containing protein [Desulfobacterales bacterium]